MTIFKVLRLEHVVARGLLEEIIERTTLSSAGANLEMTRKLVRDLRTMLISHNRAEESVFYEALRELAHHPELADTRAEEHHMIEELMEDLESTSPRDDNWNEKLAVIKSQIESHFAEEETVVFSTLDNVIDDDLGETLARSFEVLRSELMRASSNTRSFHL